MNKKYNEFSANQHVRPCQPSDEQARELRRPLDGVYIHVTMIVPYRTNHGRRYKTAHK